MRRYPGTALGSHWSLGLSALTVVDPVLLDFAAEVGAEGPVTVEGSRTCWTLGGEPDPACRVLRAPEGIVNYRPEEMTVQVRAGTTVAELHAELARSGQRTGLPDRGGTVGGAVAVGQNDLAVLGRGSVRVALLQVRYVSAEGEMVTGGGPVVKNVSGFNLPKLMVGALGTLGLVAEVILRTNPIPGTSRWLRSSEASPFAVRDALLRPSAVLWDGTSTWVQLEGHRADVDAETAELAVLGLFVQVDGPPDLPLHRWSIVPSEISRLDQAQTGPFVASVGVGTVWAAQPQPPRGIDAAAAVVAKRMKATFDSIGRLNPGRDPQRQA